LKLTLLKNSMFTGIIEEIGIIDSIQWGAKSAVLKIQARKVLEDLSIGDSINTNGICLTVTEFNSSGFSVDVMSETIKSTNLNNLKSGSKVNLEPALQISDKLGGHIVSGHIDGTGIIKDIKRDDNAIWYYFECEESVLRYIIKKGSVAIDGISLTVADVFDQIFSVSIIPHTAKSTILPDKKIGDSVNIENDVIGKYVEKFMINKNQTIKENNIDLEFLAKHGFTE